ncbi:hypothetical protein MNBD_ALPHA06-2167 [hydrothermal vent metagenome]|uniref:Uncharacterized protein n=1 Tax=hydrothermal vent metagenome TaxID=652676 RepID=A0A3B0RUR5_9ZZZZ
MSKNWSFADNTPLSEAFFCFVRRRYVFAIVQDNFFDGAMLVVGIFTVQRATYSQ